MGIRFLGTGRYLPELTISNQDFEKIVDTSDEWITTRTGIKTRHITNGEYTFQLGTKAAKQALEKAGLAAGEIDLVIGTTVTNDFFFPSLSCMVARELGIEAATCFDVSAACAGFVYAVDMAEKYLRSGDYRNVLIVSAEVLSRMTDYTDRSTCVIFGDGAAAAVLTSSDGAFSSSLKGSPQGADKIFATVENPDSPFRTKGFDYGIDQMNQMPKQKIFMAGNDVYKFAVVAMPEVVQMACEKAGIVPEELKMIIPHQANLRIVQTAMKRLNIPMERCYVNIDQIGNISSACIPLALSQISEQGTLRRGDKICIVGFGAGLAYGAAVFEW